MSGIQVAFKIKKISNGIVVKKTIFDDNTRKEQEKQYKNMEPEVYYPSLDAFVEHIVEEKIRQSPQPKSEDGSLFKLSIE